MTVASGNSTGSLVAYREFLACKNRISHANGFPCEPSEVNPILKPHQRDIVMWAVRGGRRAIFTAFGLGKTVIQLEIARLILKKSGGGRGLIVLPLGVRQEFMRDAAMLGTSVTFIRSIDEASANGIYLTNYETVRDGKLDPRAFTVLSLDEAGVLRGFGGTKTFREFMRLFEGTATYRFVATATPSPNEFIELLAYAAFLDIMDVSQAKTRFFKRNPEKADALTLHPHKQQEFWLWCASWAIFLQKPSDLGYLDTGYELPPLDVRWHMVPTDHSRATADSNGQTRLFANAALGVVDASREKHASLSERVAKTVKLVIDGREGTQRQAAADRVLPCLSAGVPTGLLPPSERAGYRASEFAREAAVHEDLRGYELGEAQQAAAGERAAATLRADTGAVPSTAGEAGLGMPDLHPPADQTGGRSRARDRQGARVALPQVQCGAGSAGGQHGQPGQSHRVLDQVVVWCDLNEEQRALEVAFASAGISYSSLTGAQPLELRDKLLAEWRRGETTVFLSKTSMYGAGVNLQRCHRMVFAGIHFKFSQVIQGIHRIHRFGQTNQCEVDLIYTEAEGEVRRQLERKWAQHTALVANMTAIIREYGLSEAAMASALSRGVGVERQEDSGAGWTLVHNDAVEETHRLSSDSVDLILTSVPFSTMYEYSPSFNDFGHTDDEAHFWAQMDFLSPQLLRVLKPGRNLAVHVKDRVVPSGLTKLGFQTVQPFHCDAIAHYIRHGFAYLGMRTIVTDVVRENTQTYRLGWTEQCKDGTRMGVGMPEYLLLFRKPPTDRTNGYADEPVIKDKPLCDDHGAPAPFDSRTNWKHPVPGTGYSRARWQFDAHGFWRASGDRLLSSEELVALPPNALYKLWRKHSSSTVYDFGEHVRIAEELDHARRLPASFMLLPPHSWHPDVWTDVTRMRTLNGSQWSRGKQMHLCPMQFDIADRTIVQMSQPGELVFDPFSGLGTVPLRALKLGRRGLGVELSASYHADAVAYLRAAENAAQVLTLFDLADDPGEGEVDEIIDELPAAADERELVAGAAS
jgi:DNA methylase/helicase-like protein